MDGVRSRAQRHSTNNVIGCVDRLFVTIYLYVPARIVHITEHKPAWPDHTSRYVHAQVAVARNRCAPRGAVTIIPTAGVLAGRPASRLPVAGRGTISTGAIESD